MSAKLRIVEPHRVGLQDRKEIRAFNEAAAKFVAKATKSSRSAHETMVSLGIYTPSGKLTKNYK